MKSSKDYLNDLDKREFKQFTDSNEIPQDATYVGDTDGDGFPEYVADTDGDGFIDTVFELVTGFFG